MFGSRSKLVKDRKRSFSWTFRGNLNKFAYLLSLEDRRLFRILLAGKSHTRLWTGQKIFLLWKRRKSATIIRNKLFIIRVFPTPFQPLQNQLNKKIILVCLHFEQCSSTVHFWKHWIKLGQTSIITFILFRIKQKLVCTPN